MARSKTVARSTPVKRAQTNPTNLTSKNNEEVLVELNLESFLTPIAIFIGALMISFSILYSVGKLSGLTTTTPPVDTPTVEQYPETQTNIDDDPILGNKKTAKVAIVEFSDYECPYCKQHYTQTHAQLVKDYIDTGKAILVFRDFPLSFHDPLATKEAIAGECVQELDGDAAYWEYHDLLFTNTTSNGTGLTTEQLYAFAAEVDVDATKFKDCLDTDKYKDEVQADLADGATATIGGTPGFIVGTLKEDGTVDGVKIEGAQDYSVFKRFLDEYLEKAK